MSLVIAKLPASVVTLRPPSKCVDWTYETRLIPKNLERIWARFLRRDRVVSCRNVIAYSRKRSRVLPASEQFKRDLRCAEDFSAGSSHPAPAFPLPDAFIKRGPRFAQDFSSRPSPSTSSGPRLQSASSYN